jgi:hypothetical protein
VARRKKRDLKDIGKVGVQLSPPTVMWKMLHPRGTTASLTVYLPAGRTTPEDASHRWWQNIDQRSQP